MKTKQKLTPRGVRLSDDHWNKLIDMAEANTKKTGLVTTPSDVIRHAVALYLKD